METKKMSLAAIKGKLSRAEMKNIMAGSGSDGECVKKGESCPYFAKCCNECNASFKCT
jgi:hypothetical protein